MRFDENVEKFPAEELAKYGGKLVAWWPDGTRIIDADFDGVALFERLRENGYTSSFFTLERIPFPDEMYV
jgi:hypothetical protein